MFVSWAATVCHYMFFFFQIPLLKLLPKKKKVYHQLMVILTFLLMKVSKQLSLINSKAGC